MAIIIEPQATLRDTGTSADSWGIGDNSVTQVITLKASLPGFDPYIRFIPGTGWVVKHTAGGAETLLGSGGGAIIEDTIVDGVTDKGASQNAIFDALALKATKTSTVENSVEKVTAESATSVVTVDATTAGETYSQVQANTVVTLVNDVKFNLNEVITLVNEIRNDYNISVNLMNELKSKMDTMNA